jgi:hypothetical protein
MFGWSKREREEAAAQAAAQADAVKRDWLTHCTQAGFSQQQAEFLFGLVTTIDTKINSASQNSSIYAMYAATMAMSAGGARTR